MNILYPPGHSTKAFNWNAVNREFVADISDLRRPVMGRVYDDACDLGLTLVSERTGGEVVTVISEEVRNQDGEIECWILVPADRRNTTFHIRLFND